MDLLAKDVVNKDEIVDGLHAGDTISDDDGLEQFWCEQDVDLEELEAPLQGLALCSNPAPPAPAPTPRPPTGELRSSTSYNEWVCHMNLAMCKVNVADLDLALSLQKLAKGSGRASSLSRERL